MDVKGEKVMYTLKVKKLIEDAKLPSFAKAGDAGMDVYAAKELVIMPRETALVPTGIAIELPKNTEAQVRPRSGLALKHGITVLNGPGTIDEGYRGEVCIILINHGKEAFKVEKHMKIAQLVVKPIYEIEIKEASELNESERGTGGFGSTGGW
ncbi:dUTP diphosphatase [Clostridium cellulovorans]|uniref:Deoxyuridine 5'-triphosphate nucleotidohydrolase n=1 Tax=Clostridium cellulovorans (strain ATCC 35296 / DSM 3052 / OCM 3 / 743B) TaxID=573061 RepID=D9SX51_CLOC7|nr:deoxyuridine 5'-triphosphate nucleotidohydrolase Dut [Clostridium cellulovorans 743B]